MKTFRYLYCTCTRSDWRFSVIKSLAFDYSVTESLRKVRFNSNSYRKKKIHTDLRMNLQFFSIFDAYDSLNTSVL